jgi:OmcA/MtrC family decaheme c-type cytochrome
MATGLIFGLCITVAGSITNCDEAEAASAFARPADSTELHLNIGSVEVNSPPVVQFTVTNENGDPVLLTQDDIASGALRFGIAKLVPGSNGDADRWQSYINTVERANPDVGPDGSAVLASAMQATVETRTSAGTLTRNDDGSYTYRFKTDITDPAQTMGVGYQPALTHRVAMQVELEGRHGRTIVSNPYFDFVPAGGEVTTNKRVVHKDACNECHHELALHGGGRIETEYCVVCHNPGTVDANSGNGMNFSPMIHKIHMGEELSRPYIIWGFRDSEHDYSTVVYPQDHRNCTKCHSAEREETPEGDNWKLRPTKVSCTACHEAVDFANHPREGEVQADNSRCAQCHVPFSSTLDFAIENAHVNPVDVLAGQFRYNILALRYDPGTRRITVDFSVTDPTNANQPYDIQNHPAFTAGGGASRMAILIGWNSSDFRNTGSRAAPAQPISIDPLFGGASNMGGNRFRVSTTLPNQASGTGSVAIEGHPAVDDVRIPVANAVQYFAISGQMQPRRQIVSIDKCNDCHENLSLHGNNRQGTVEVCVICHNPDATDLEVRPATVDEDDNGVFDDFTALGVDGLREESIHFKTMIHAIHAGAAEEHGYREAGIVVYGFRRSVNDYSEVRYPGILSNCTACHLEGTYRVNATAGALGTTVETASPFLAGNQPAIDQALEDPADDLNVSPETASCASCHDSAEAMEHMEVVGRGVFDQTQPVIHNTVWEDCGGCHGPHEFKDVATVHQLR